MYIGNLNNVLPKEIQDNWITFQALCDILKPKRIFLSTSSATNCSYFFFDGEKQAVLFSYIDPFHNSVWMINESKFTFDGGELGFPLLRRRRRKRKEVKTELMDFESARKFIEYLELF